jgi:hypothetical protein
MVRLGGLEPHTDLALIRVAWLGFTTTYKTAGTAKHRVSRTRHRILWVGLWVGKGFDCAIERATYLRAKPSRSPETQRPTQTSGT